MKIESQDVAKLLILLGELNEKEQAKLYKRALKLYEKLGIRNEDVAKLLAELGKSSPKTQRELYEKSRSIYEELDIENEKVAKILSTLGESTADKEKQHDLYLRSLCIYTKLGLKNEEAARLKTLVTSPQTGIEEHYGRVRNVSVRSFHAETEERNNQPKADTKNENN